MSPSQVHEHRTRALPCCFRWGGAVGGSIALTLVAWLLVANRVPSLDRFAQGRNLAAALAVGTLMLVLFFRFLKSPGRVFLSGMIAWAVFTGTYFALEKAFPRLEHRLGAFHLFVLGAAAFGEVAVALWVAHMLLLAWRAPVALASRRLP